MWFYKAETGNFAVGAIPTKEVEVDGVITTKEEEEDGWVLIDDRPNPIENYIFDGISGWVAKPIQQPTSSALKATGLPYILNGVTYQIPLDKDAQDMIVAITVQLLAGVFTGTTLEFSNGTKMALTPLDILAFATWFCIERNKFFI